MRRIGTPIIVAIKKRGRLLASGLAILMMLSAPGLTSNARADSFPFKATNLSGLLFKDESIGQHDRCQMTFKNTSDHYISFTYVAQVYGSNDHLYKAQTQQYADGLAPGETSQPVIVTFLNVPNDDQHLDVYVSCTAVSK